MPKILKKTKIQGLEDTDQVLGLLPIDRIQQQRREYGTLGISNAVPAHVLSRQGIFAQLVDPHSRTIAQQIPLFEDVIMEEEIVNNDVEVVEDEKAVKQAKKKEQQWKTWNDVIPTLLQPYLSLLQKTASLRDLDKVKRHTECQGCEDGQQLQVFCIFFNRIETVVLCNCTSIAVQLINRGLFPSAPKAPTLAVDLCMLDFVQELFVNAAPNITAWCETLEAFLHARKFKLRTRNSLRGRFSNALHWYTGLVDLKNSQLHLYLNAVRGNIFGSNDRMNEDNQESDNLERPSEYLRERCPLCFGGENWFKPNEIVDVIICLDACFTQKRRKNQGNAWIAPRIHPNTVFVSADDSVQVEEMVENIRPSQPSKRSQNISVTHRTGSTEADVDGFEHGIKVPTSVLNECNDSFLAADSNRIKASTQFFADTGLMALMCRHDRVLWLANMTSAGEKQHYAICLLYYLFQHIPKKMRVGVLYDIGCQLHRSCVKFNFLEDAISRVVFGISVFHAYGHQWPCQIIYHPRKCEGFGLTDGEGCERFWSSIKLLIPSLRVSGYYNRIYTLDTQIKHLDKKSLLDLGTWLNRKWSKMTIRKADVSEVLAGLQDIGITRPYLYEQWKLQKIEQTKPLAKQAKNLANKEIQEILTLNSSLDIYKQQVYEYQSMVDSGNYKAEWTLSDIQTFLEEAQGNVSQIQKSIITKKKKLSIDGRLTVNHLLDNEFLKTRMNALALKQRIRDRLRQRKFELENLERAYRKTQNQMKLDNHAKAQVKRKEPGIQALVRKYNKLCQDLAIMIRAKEAPRGAIAPSEINMEGLWSLDVDDNIWQDIGLTSETDDLLNIPAWLGNDNVKSGIKALLEYDRCVEEERRLVAERISIQQWMREEWVVVNAAINMAVNDEGLVYELQKRREYLLEICVKWRAKLQDIPYTGEVSWGPSLTELENASNYEVEAQVHIEGDDDSDSENNISSEQDIEEAEVLNSVESLTFGHWYDF